MSRLLAQNVTAVDTVKGVARVGPVAQVVPVTGHGLADTTRMFGATVAEHATSVLMVTTMQAMNAILIILFAKEVLITLYAGLIFQTTSAAAIFGQVIWTLLMIIIAAHRIARQLTNRRLLAVHLAAVELKQFIIPMVVAISHRTYLATHMFAPHLLLLLLRQPSQQPLVVQKAELLTL